MTIYVIFLYINFFLLNTLNCVDVSAHIV